jgi:hypothetical protein
MNYTAASGQSRYISGLIYVLPRMVLKLYLLRLKTLFLIKLYVYSDILQTMAKLLYTVYKAPLAVKVKSV